MSQDKLAHSFGAPSKDKSRGPSRRLRYQIQAIKNPRAPGGTRADRCKTRGNTNRRRYEALARFTTSLRHWGDERVTGRIHRTVNIIARHALAATGARARGDRLVVQHNPRMVVHGRSDGASRKGREGRSGKSNARQRERETYRESETAHKSLHLLKDTLGTSPWGNAAVSHAGKRRARLYRRYARHFCKTTEGFSPRHPAPVIEATTGTIMR